MRGGADDHYKTLTLSQLVQLNIEKLAKPDCALFMWTTSPMLADGTTERVIRAWGFTPKTIAFVWRKMNKKSPTPFYGLGRWTRSNMEYVVLGIKGKPQRVSKSVRQELQYPLGAHSSKPPLFRDRVVELMGKDKSYLELFARIDSAMSFTPHPDYLHTGLFDMKWEFTGLEFDGFDLRDL